MGGGRGKAKEKPKVSSYTGSSRRSSLFRIFKDLIQDSAGLLFMIFTRDVSLLNRNLHLLPVVVLNSGYDFFADVNLSVSIQDIMKN